MYRPIVLTVCTLLLAAAILAVDAWTKYSVYYHFHAAPFLHEEVPVFKDFLGIDFSITYAPNKGAAWGFFASWQSVLLALRITAVMGLLLFLVFFNKNRYQIIPLTMITVGALGNIVDTLIYGHVVDMFLFTFWGYNFAVFNVADASICVGIFLQFCNGFFELKDYANHVPSSN